MIMLYDSYDIIRKISPRYGRLNDVVRDGPNKRQYIHTIIYYTVLGKL